MYCRETWVGWGMQFKMSHESAKYIIMLVAFQQIKTETGLFPLHIHKCVSHVVEFLHYIFT